MSYSNFLNCLPKAYLFWFCLLLGVRDKIHCSSVVSLYFTGLWILYNWRSFFFFSFPASSFSCPGFFTLSTWFFFLPISTYHPSPPLRTHARLHTLYGPVTICNYHKCFIFSMHRLKLDCCMLAHFSMQQLVNFNSKPVTFVTKFLVLKVVFFVAWQFLEL